MSASIALNRFGIDARPGESPPDDPKGWLLGQFDRFEPRASPYRDRSHFDGQNVLETGGADAYQVRDGWLNRLLGVLPAEEAKAIAVAATVPMALRGPNKVSSYAASYLPDASADMMQRVAMLYAGDSQLHALWSEAMATDKLAGDIGDAGRNAAATGALAAKLLAPADGARLAMIETTGWDTHTAQRGRLATQLKALDALVDALHVAARRVTGIHHFRLAIF